MIRVGFHYRFGGQCVFVYVFVYEFVCLVLVEKGTKSKGTLESKLISLSKAKLETKKGKERRWQT